MGVLSIDMMTFAGQTHRHFWHCHPYPVPELRSVAITARRREPPISTRKSPKKSELAIGIAPMVAMIDRIKARKETGHHPSRMPKTMILEE